MENVNDLPKELYESLVLKVQEIKNGEYVSWEDVKKELEEKERVYLATGKFI